MKISSSSFDLVTILLCGRKKSEFNESLKLTRVVFPSFFLHLALFPMSVAVSPLWERETEREMDVLSLCSVWPWGCVLYRRLMVSTRAEDGACLFCWYGFLITASKLSGQLLSSSGLLQFYLPAPKLGSGYRFRNCFYYLVKQREATVVKDVSHPC